MAGAEPLAARLARLRRALGADVSPPVIDGVPAAGIDRWRIGAALALRERGRNAAAAALPGEPLAPGVRLVRRRLPDPGVTGIEAVWAGPRPLPPLVFFDIETTGLAGGTGTHAFLVGLGWHADGGFELRQFLLQSPSAEAPFLDAIAAALPAGATLVSFNGGSFDLPLLAARYRLARRPDPFAALPHLDLMPPLRRAYASRWPDCRLQRAERQLLGIERVDDLPGALAPQAWTHFLRHGDAALLRRLIEHHRQDVVSLPRLALALDAVHRDPAAHGADAAALARGLERRGRRSEAERLLRAADDLDARLALARHYRRQGRHAEARRLLEPLVAAPQPPAAALEQLAMLAEHVERDVAAARRLAERLLEREPGNARHQRRLDRLRRRTGG